MSFFGHMLAGTAAGVGQGMAQIGTMMEREQGARALQQEKQAGALELARQRDQDRADRERDNLLLRKEIASGRSGSGGGKSGFNLMQMAMDVAPEKQGQFVEAVRAFGGDDAASVVERIYGRGAGGPQTTPAPTMGAVGGAVPEQQAQQPAQRGGDAERGRLALNRLMAMASGPEHLKPYAEGERQLGLNDFATAGARQALQTGASAQDAGETFNTVSNPRVNLAANDLATQRLERMREAEEGKNQRHAQTLSERETRSGRDALLKERKQLEKTATSLLADQGDIDSARSRMAEIDQQLQSGGSKPAAPGRAPTAARSAYEDWKSKTGTR